MLIQFEQTGAAREGLTLDSIRSFKVPLPSPEEQVAIIEHLQVATANIDTTITRAEREIELLTEYRTRLIADVVTGKLDVRDAAAALPKSIRWPRAIARMISTPASPWMLTNSTKPPRKPSMTTDTSERGQTLICTALAGNPCDPPGAGTVGEPSASYGGGLESGQPARLRPRVLRRSGSTGRLPARDPAGGGQIPSSMKMARRGVSSSPACRARSPRGHHRRARHGISTAYDLDLFCSASEENEKAKALFEQNRFTVTRQLKYSRDDRAGARHGPLHQRPAGLHLRAEALPQTTSDAVWQYQKDRNPREKLFEFGRCVVHFALDESEVMFCTHLKGEASWFLPFNRGWNDGAGNHPTSTASRPTTSGRVLTRREPTNILENFAQVVEAKDEKTNRKKKTQIWPRYHQLDVVRRLLADVAEHGAGKHYLIQHSAGSGKSNSIAWPPTNSTG